MISTLLNNLIALTLLVACQPAGNAPTQPSQTQPTIVVPPSTVSSQPVPIRKTMPTVVTRRQIEEAINSGSRISLNGQNLQGLDLSGLNLDGFDFSYANLDEANLSGASLNTAIFWSVRARKVNLSQANLIGANLGTADLSESNLQGVILRKASLLGTSLNKADLNGADLREANLQNASLEGAIYNAQTRWPRGFMP
jgi:Pentapeptide repeats (8 copies)